MRKKTITRQHQSEAVILDLIAASVALTGLLTVAGVLFAQSRLRHEGIVSLDAHVTLLVGLTFTYLAALLRRGKHNAWLIALPLYIFIVVRNFRHLLFDLPADIHNPALIILQLLVPAVALVGLIIGRKYFVVRSELATFAVALRRAALVLVIAFLYGFIGFQLLDEHDFHREIPLQTGAHYTIDQLNVTTDQDLMAYTKRAKLFLDSLAIISVGSLFYVGLSFFAPIRFRLSDQRRNRQDIAGLLKKYPANSEDFFKLWPHDKAYFFNNKRTSALAFRVKYGTALVVGDPAGSPKDFKNLLGDFINYCHINDWEPALIHTQEQNIKMYETLGFDTQKIGEEAVVDIKHFQNNVSNNKYFRNIKNRFAKQNYSVQIFSPPHSKAFLRRLKQISDEWLELPGRSERGFMMGYFNEDYLQQCDIMVAQDNQEKIQAFINQIPSYDKKEANFDFLRSAKHGHSNINDYLMLCLINHLSQQGFKRINMGLAPLTGLKKTGKAGTEISAIDNALQLVYSAGGRFYSFEGLKRFKDKYEPNWQSRYVVYRGGLRGFSRTMNALVRAMKI
jgi:phosphatidylglycerol lysyltransferase